MKRAKTLADIARLAGVAESTVSRALKDSPLISAATKQRVLAIATEHNFHIDVRAQNFKMGKSQTIAVIINLSPTSGQVLSDPFLLGLVGCIADEVAVKGYDLLFSTMRDFSARQALAYLAGRKADGLLIVGQGADPSALEYMAEQKVPFVVWGQQCQPSHYVTVGSDNSKGAYLASRHLLDQGRSNLLFLGDTNHIEIAARYRGFQQALAEKKLDASHSMHATAAFCMQSGFEQTQRILADNNPIDGIVCSSDLIAIGCINAITAAGKNVPNDIAVTGYDDVLMAEFFAPALTTVAQDIKTGAQQMVAALLAMIDGNEGKGLQLEPTLVVRESA